MGIHGRCILASYGTPRFTYGDFQNAKCLPNLCSSPASVACATNYTLGRIYGFLNVFLRAFKCRESIRFCGDSFRFILFLFRGFR
jgi:hypothetical protein